jgi:hypothetical protein
VFSVAVSDICDQLKSFQRDLEYIPRPLGLGD